MKIFGSTLVRRRATLLLVALVSFTTLGRAQTLYVSVNHGGGTSILRVTSSTVTSLVSNLDHPTGLVSGPDGRLYVSQDLSGTATSLVSRVTLPGGAVSTFISGLQLPVGLTFDPSGNLFIADYNTSSTIYQVPAGTATAAVFASGISGAIGVTSDSSGAIFVTHRELHTVSRLNTSGGAFTNATTYATGLGQATDLVFDHAGNLFVSDFGTGALNTGAIFKVAPGGAVSTFVSNLTSPNGLAFDPVTGSLFIADQAFGSILQVTNLGGATGNVSTFATGLNAFGAVQYLTVATSAVPEPSTYAMSAGAAILGFSAWRRRALRDSSLRRRA